MGFLLSLGEYSNGNTAIEIQNKDGVYTKLTANIKKLPKTFACIDVNNFPEAESFITKHHLGTSMKMQVASGFCNYPIYKLDMNAISSYAASNQG